MAFVNSYSGNGWIEIPKDSEIFDLSAEALREMLIHLRQQIHYRELIDYLDYYHYELLRPERQRDSYFWVLFNDELDIRTGEVSSSGNIGWAIECAKTIEDNPFATAEHGLLSKMLLNQLDSFFQTRNKKRLLRSAPKRLRQAIIERDKSACRYCSTALNDEIHLDHVVPYSLGGKTDFENLVVSCKACNLRKNGRTLEESGFVLLPEPDSEAAQIQ